MNKLDIIDATIRIYEELYQQCTVKKNYTLIIRKFENQQLENFATALIKNYRAEEINVDLLIRYFEYQFSRYVGVQTKYGTNSILLHWLIGKKALKEWENRNVKKNWQVKVKLHRDFSLQLARAFKDQSLIDQAKVTVNLLNETNPTEEQAKNKFHNLPEGLTWCGTTTTLYNPVSQLCQACTYKTGCMDLLKENYPNLYKTRIKHDE